MQSGFLKENWRLVTGSVGLIGITAITASAGDYKLAAVTATTAALLAGAVGLKHGISLGQSETQNSAVAPTTPKHY